MPKSLTVVREDGSVSFYEMGKLIYLLILAAFALIAIYAINDFITKIIQCYVPRKDAIWGYFIYMIIAVAMVIFIVYIGCYMAPDITEYITPAPL